LIFNRDIIDSFPFRFPSRTDPIGLASKVIVDDIEFQGFPTHEFNGHGREHLRRDWRVRTPVAEMRLALTCPREP